MHHFLLVLCFLLYVFEFLKRLICSIFQSLKLRFKVMLVYIGVLNRDLILQYLTQQVTGEQIFKISDYFRNRIDIFAKTSKYSLCSSQMKSGYPLKKSKRKCRNISQPFQQLRKKINSLLLNKFHHDNFYSRN